MGRSQWKKTKNVRGKRREWEGRQEKPPADEKEDATRYELIDIGGAKLSSGWHDPLVAAY